MRRCPLRLLSFQQLLCGSKVVLKDISAMQTFASSFRANHPVAPIPVPVAAGLGRSYLLQKEPRRVVALLASHPSAQEVGQHLLRLLSGDNSVDVKTMLQLADALRSVSPVTCCGLLCVLAQRVAKTDESRQVKQLLMREVREVPHLSGTLVSSLCVLSDHAVEQDRRDVVDAFNIALRKSFVSAKDYGAVLLLLARGGDHKKALTLWSWMSHSSARWDQTAVSAVIISASLTRRMNTAIDAIHCLAEANKDPTVEAQRQFIRFLAYRLPPLTAYAEQLINHWHTQQQLWTTEARVVGVELLFAHYHSQNFVRVYECLAAASDTLETVGNEAKGPEGVEAADNLRQEIMRVVGMPYILRHFAMDVNNEPWLQKFYNSGMRMKDLGEYPLLLGVLASIARHMKDEGSFITLMGSVEISAENFEVVVNFIAEDNSFRDAQDTLQFVSRLAKALCAELPKGVINWLQLLSQT
uniref:Uncharacterized protein TCIL3000_6_730 n=1 Tax=Trypanosoma congolense (strain IL3000) TaxID=1068625 RepID=G0UN85_TRYCI|nr:unnamed protein product [Trypanosoma congolense IL3000]